MTALADELSTARQLRTLDEIRAAGAAAARGLPALSDQQIARLAFLIAPVAAVGDPAHAPTK